MNSITVRLYWLTTAIFLSGTLITKIWSQTQPGCSLSQCTDDQFQCKNCRCIMKSWLCNHANDCGDGSDEHSNCTYSSCDSHEFTCKNHRCIHQSWVCDNNDDCTDGSDELGCRKKSCPDWLWTCPDNGDCIPISKVCDGNNNCANRSDESSSCSSSQCSFLSCDHGCHKTPFGGKCYCSLGMTLNPADNRTCIDFDECSGWGYCDQKCTNQAGSYSCSCYEGYTLKDNKHCAVTNGEPLVFFVGTRNKIFSINSTGHKLLTEIPSLAFDIDFNYARKKLFWINNKQQIIQANTDGQNKMVLPITGLGFPYRLAMDWITNTLYFSDKYRRIGIYCLDTGDLRSIITDDIGELGGLAVDPTSGYLFYSQSRISLRTNGKIVRSFMDGSHRMTLRLDKVLNPIYLTLDIVNQRLYWIDSYLDYIQTIDYYGRFRQTILSGGMNIPHPLSVSLFENQVFWADATKMGVLRVNKYDGLSSVSQIFRTTNEQIMSLKVFHPSTQMSKNVNPCKTANCEQLCVLSHTSENNGLGFKCLCRTGYTLVENQINCTKIEEFLLLAGRYAVQGIPLTPSTSYAIDAIPSLVGLGRYTAVYVGIDYTASDETIYFSEMFDHVIYKAHLNGSGLEPLISYDVGTVEGIAVDWLSRNLYFTDSQFKSISAVRIDHPEDRRKLISNIGNPRAISIHPYKGWIFYTDWLRNMMQKAYIARANCDGTDIVRIRQHELGWPNGLSIDYNAERLYWSDAYFNRIQHSDFNGNDVQTISEPRIFHPFGIAVYKDYIYFTDWETHKLIRMNKNGRDLTTIKKSSSYMMDLKIYNKDLQQSSGIAPCIHRNGGCSHFCFPIPVPNRQVLNAHCGCPYGMKLSSNLRDCEPNPDETPKPNCTANLYQCANRRCIHHYFRCNGENDCLDNSDEIDCNPDRTCSPDHFQCKNGVCINKHWVCDGDYDCRDNSDEANCTMEGTCSEREFKCNNSLCISLAYKCDTENDCGDGSDEGDFCAEHTCLSEYFQCDNKRCISKYVVCDGDNDCFDNSDERNCPPVTCKTWEWMCQSKKQCINKGAKCDSSVDCSDGSDEVGCPHESSKDCKSLEFKCAEGGCIPNTWKCDGQEDCQDGSDEAASSASCPPPVCPEDRFQCKNGMCIFQRWVCDGYNDCGDMSDEDKELTCPPPPFSCPVGQWECPGGNRICIQNSKVCDGNTDCPEGHDEGPLCNTDSCRINNGGCSNICITTPFGAQCLCPPGEELNGTKICGDKNECDPPGHCSQKCVNTIGSFKCFCDPGYQMLEDRRTCRIPRNDTVPYIFGLSRRKMVKTNLDTTRATIIQVSRWIRIIDIDVRNSSIYLGNHLNQIFEYSLEGIKRKTIMPAGIGILRSIAVDWIGRNLYWTDMELKKIEVMSLEGTNRTILLEGAYRPADLVLDPREGSRFMFWSNTQPTIYRAGMDGSNQTVIISEKIHYISALTIDYPNKFIYFADTFMNFIDFCDYDGKNRHRVISSTSLLHVVRSITVIEDRLYWTERHSRRMYHCNKYNCESKMIVSSPIPVYYGIVSYSKVRQPSSSNPCFQSPCSHICLLSPINPGYKCGCPYAMRLSNNGKDCVTFNAEFLIYKDIISITPLTWDNNTETSVVSIAEYQYYKKHSSLDYDGEKGYLYFLHFSWWTRLRRMSFAGLNATDAWPYDFFNIPVGIAIDWISRNFYSISDNFPAIEVIRLDGDAHYYRKILGNNDQPTGVFKPICLCLDPQKGFVYWSDLGGGHVPKKIAEVKMDGTGSRILIKDNLNHPNYLTKDPSASVLYWSEGYLGKIMRYDISQNRREIVLENLANPKGIAVYKGVLYYTEADRQEIKSIPLNSLESGSVTLKRGLRRLTNLIVFYARHLSNYTNSCSGNNYGGCEQLCLPTGENSRKCECNTGLIKDAQGNCKAGSSFLMVAAGRAIRGYSLESNDHPEVMVPFSTQYYFSTPRMAAYVKENYIYLSSMASGIVRMQPDGSKMETLVDKTFHRWGLYTIAIDWIAGNFYFVTTSYRNQELKVSRLDLSHQLVILDRHINEASIRQIITNICINPIKRYLYWLSYSGKPILARARLDGTNFTILVQTGIRKPTDITVDILTHDVYWVDAVIDALQRINYNGGNREYIRGNLVSPIGVAVLGNNVYWADFSLQKIFTVAKNTKVGPPTVVMNNMDRIQTIRIFDAAIQPEVSNPCSTDYGGCEQLCFAYPNNSTAVCKCATGVIGPDGRSCVPPEEFLLYAADSKVLTIHLDLDNRAKPIPPITGLSSAVSVDYDYQEGYIYFSQFRAGKLSRVKKGSNVVEDIVYMNNTQNSTGNREDMQAASGLAVDWVGEKLYWTDFAKNKVMCMNFATNHKVTLAHATNPRAIALNPCKGYMYWTTLGGPPKIERATMAGNQRSAIITSGLGMPSGLTIDYKDEKIFWADSALNRIERSDLDGNYREVIIGVVLKPYSIAVFGNFIYWSEWNQNSISRAEKHTGDNERVFITNLRPKPMGIKIYSKTLQTCSSDPCQVFNGGCSHGCHPAPDGKAECSCDDDSGLVLANDQKMCVLKDNNCTSMHFICANGKCIFKRWMCDIHDDCGDNSDEHPNICALHMCDPSTFRCDNGHCIRPQFRCDFDNDCGDNSDEIDCAHPTCGPNEFECKNFRCINQDRVCDNYDNCRDGAQSDEQNCPTNITCMPGKVKCPNNNICLNSRFLCDGEDDCGDNQDENPMFCQTATCAPGDFRCPNSHRCISRNWVCDGDNDCGNMEDEPSSCRSKNQTCNQNTFTCSNGRCISLMWVCDGENDCLDGSDEAVALQCGQGTCPPNFFACPSNSRLGLYPCINSEFVCDGDNNCVGGEDELQSCPPRTCGESQFACTNGLCIPSTYYCDHDNDCGDNSDEPSTCEYRTCNENQFVCDNRRCIPLRWVCDTDDDCLDKSDEKPSLCFTPGPTCPTGQFLCRNGECIDYSIVCNKQNDCSDGSDEEHCYINECENTELNQCQHECVDTITSFHCECHAGFNLMNDRKACKDIDECNVTPEVCSQSCLNTVGNFTCKCNEGYQKQIDRQTCKRKDNITPWLIFSNRYYIRELSTDGQIYRRISQGYRSVVSLDFDYAEQRLYSIDMRDSKIHRMFLNGTNIETIMPNAFGNRGGIAVDWVGRKLYWFNSVHAKLHVSELNGTNFATLLTRDGPDKRGLNRPVGLVADPGNGYLYWTDWGNTPRIGRLGMDGSNYTLIITEKLGWPNGLTIEYETNRLWWADAHLDYIEYANADGTNRHTVIQGNLPHIFAITIFEDWIYWTDLRKKTIEKANKYTGANRVILKNTTHSPRDIHVMHPLRQRQHPNPCGTNNGGCSHLCLLTPNNNYRCLCPNDFILTSDNRTCLANCSDSQFRCGITDDRCIPISWKCDGQKDCMDGSDEPEDCPATKCFPGQFTCKNANCTFYMNVCDQHDDCGDGSDEENCDKWTCPSWEWKCKNNKCIPEAWKCDGDDDCGDKSDEAPEECVYRTCKPSEFTCANGACIYLEYKCDFDRDCLDASDESEDLNCDNKTCPENTFKCATNYRCVPRSYVCDGDDDCRDNSDEVGHNCEACKPNYFQCNNNRCIPQRWLCDFEDDCGDGSDEKLSYCNDKYRSCSESEFQCSNKKCIQGKWRCDYDNDCGDESDEINCPKTECPNGKFKCNNGHCIHPTGVCNGERDCTDVSDESNCTARYPNGKYCLPNMFECKNTLCISPNWRCDGMDDCGDGSDEALSVCTKVECPSATHFRCNNFKCIPRWRLCDKIDNCGDASDENDRQLCQPIVTRCEANQFKCRNSKCIDSVKVCDAFKDCEDASDEQGCHKASGSVNCSVNNGGCAHNCTDLENGGFYCSCQKGYNVSATNSKECEDIDECAEWGNNCPQICTNLKGSFKCSCLARYRQTVVPFHQCKTRYGVKPIGFVTIESEIRTFTYNNYKILETFNTSRPKALALNSLHMTIYWTDSAQKAIYWDFFVPNPRSKVKLHTADLQEPNGITVDWVSSNIYWTDAGKKSISVAAYDGRYSRTLIRYGLRKPHAIVTNPKIGWMYWTDINSDKPTIERAWMTGEKREVLVDKRLAYPTGIAIDYLMEDRVFWCDAKLNVIESMKADGSNRVVVVGQGLQNPVSIVIYENHLYWLSQSNGKLMKMDKLGRDVNITLLSGLVMPKNIALFYEKIANEENVKSKCIDQSTCSHLCLIKPGGYKCACPENTELLPGSNTVCNAASETAVELSHCHCENGGTCVKKDEKTYVCKCLTGFYGNDCTSLTPEKLTTQIKYTKVAAIVVPIVLLILIAAVVLGGFFFMKKRGKFFLNKPQITGASLPHTQLGAVSFQDGDDVNIGTPPLSYDIMSGQEVNPLESEYSSENPTCPTNFSNPMYGVERLQKKAPSAPGARQQSPEAKTSEKQAESTKSKSKNENLYVTLKTGRAFDPTEDTDKDTAGLVKLGEL